MNPTDEVVSILKGSILSDLMRITFCLVHRKLDDHRIFILNMCGIKRKIYDLKKMFQQIHENFKVCFCLILFLLL